jgi:hypothetical protein
MVFPIQPLIQTQLRRKGAAKQNAMLHSSGLFGTILVVLWLLLAAAMIISPTNVFRLLGRRLPLSVGVVLTFRVLGFVNALGCAYLLFARRG